MNQRSYEKEWIDLGPSYYSAEEYRSCLYQLDRIGRFLGGDQANFWAFKQLKFYPSSILDVGCGGGLFTLRLAAHYPKAKVVGTDISKEAIEFAQKHLQKSSKQLSNVSFIVPPSPELSALSDKFDVIIATLVCHHLSDEELISFLRQACLVAKKTVIINDLHRHFLATLGFATIAPLFFRNRLIWDDGLLSIKRGFKRSEWESYLHAAGIKSPYFQIKWHWAFRWMVIIDTAAVRKEILHEKS